MPVCDSLGWLHLVSLSVYLVFIQGNLPWSWHTVLVPINLSFCTLVILLHFKKNQQSNTEVSPTLVAVAEGTATAVDVYRCWVHEEKDSIKYTVPEYVSHDFTYSLPSFTMHLRNAWMVYTTMPPQKIQEMTEIATEPRHSMI